LSSHHHLQARRYVASIGTIIVAAAVLYLIFRRKDWI
jgi:hypothetical protein